jgi:hypothetical protein
MNTRTVALALVLVSLAGGARAATNSLFVSGNVMTGQTWNAALNAGNGSSGSCSVSRNPVEYYSVPFFTDVSAGTYRLHIEYSPAESGYVYLYQDGFDPGNPCNNLFVFGVTPVADIPNIHLDANRQYFAVTSEAVLYGGPGSFQLTITGPTGSHLFFGNGAGTPGSFCFGDGFDPNVSVPCPCGNLGSSGRGCNNSAGSGGAMLVASGSLTPDALVLQVSGELPTALSIFFQGDAILYGGVTFGEGIRCSGGSLMRIGVKTASGGSASYPGAGDTDIRTQSANEGNPIPSGSIRYYQVYYRDPSTTFCPNIPNNSFNVSNGLRVTWP